MANITTAITTAAPSGTAVRATERANVIEEPIGIALAALVSLGQTGTDKLAQARPDMRLNVSAEESIQDAIRLSITMPAKDSTKRTPNTAGAAETLNWSAMLAGPSANKVGVSNAWQNLHLTVPEGFDLDEQSGTIASWDQDQDPVTSPGTQQTTEGSAAKPGAAAAHALRGETSTIAAQTELRAVQQQQLADRLGEAAAHRLIAQIERGEWKMQMRLQPGKLGKIDIELTMHARGLEALFSADSALTRELIAQGSARLKDTLTQAGMTVASVTVNGDQARQSGGNPTPQHGNQAYADPRPVKAPREEPLASVETSPTRTNDRLNILA
jgi:flagellar hook-length control protein FliK